jgi:hypothetical protein
VQFWKCISSFSKREKNSVELDIDGNHLSQPHEVAETSAGHLKTAFNNPCLHGSSTSSWSFHSTTSRLVKYLDMTLLVFSRKQVDVICFDFSSVLNFVTCAMLLHLSAAYIS